MPKSNINKCKGSRPIDLPIPPIYALAPRGLK
jgi:hypothetical protein